MTSTLGSALVVLVASGSVAVDCGITGQDAVHLVLTAQAVKYDPIIPPVPGAFVGGRDKLCAIVAVEVDDEGKVQSATVYRSEPRGVLDREAVRAARLLQFDMTEIVRGSIPLLLYFRMELGPDDTMSAIDTKPKHPPDR